MNYLLDTNFLIWTLSGLKNIPTSIFNVIENSGNNIFVSTVSLWEISIKQNLGKLEINNLNFTDIKVAIDMQDFKIINLEIEDSINLAKLPRFTNHKDPFDRMLIQQAINRNLTIITSDNKFNLYKEYGLKHLS